MFVSLLTRGLANDQLDDLPAQFSHFGGGASVQQKVERLASVWRQGHGEVQGAMNDASKRNRSPQSSSYPSEYKVCSPVTSSFAGDGSSSPPRRSSTSTSARTTSFKPIIVEEDRNGTVRYKLIMPAKPQNQVALPSDVESLLKWSTRLFVCPKFEEKRWNYAEMVLRAMYDKDVLNYVSWAQSRYGNSKPEPGTLSDLVAFLQAINFVAEDWTTQREFKP